MIYATYSFGSKEEWNDRNVGGASLESDAPLRMIVTPMSIVLVQRNRPESLGRTGEGPAGQQ